MPFQTPDCYSSFISTNLMAVEEVKAQTTPSPFIPIPN